MTNLQMCLIGCSALLTASAFFLYFRATLQSAVRPNRWSWLIWTFGSGVEVLTFQAISNDIITAAVFWFAFAAALATTLVIWLRGTWRRPDRVETLCGGASLIGLTVALGFGYAWLGHLIAVMAIPLSFAPTWISVWRDYRQEECASWMLWTLSDLAALALVLTRFQTSEEIVYASVEACCHGAVWMLLVLARVRSFTEAKQHSGTAFDLGGPVTVGRNHLGQAVFARRDLRAGDFILQIKGDLIPSYDMPEWYHGTADRYMQVDSNLFIGPSGGADDLVNHSCDPNAGIRFTSYGMLLTALKDIMAGEEVVWDYSTTMLGINWSMRCDCRSPSCRGQVAEFTSLSSEKQAQYLSAGIVAPFIEDHLRTLKQIDAWLQDAAEDSVEGETSGWRRQNRAAG